MLQAIEVKYLGPTQTRGSRWKATAQAGSLTVPMDYELDHGGNAERAARLLVARLDWDDWATLHGGALPNGDYVFTLSSTHHKEAV